jgi:hypothetical protein
MHCSDMVPYSQETHTQYHSLSRVRHHIMCADDGGVVENTKEQQIVA